ncbi:CMGC family protein kinase [Histomonas meleagridis]|uniref:CMGC family protein kinase n=1 Tax=Histomonas meleagridis TaxID=135588 RepID=UPI00355A7BDF|nr:CMGC family protein kinase [Histomonas meleagridis]KAH0797357.1 CMGC family protein kinase [Histomonas meleagridis]
MKQRLLDNSTLYLRELYHLINSEKYPNAVPTIGRILNPQNEGSETQGHQIVAVNEIFIDQEHHEYRIIDVLGQGTFSYVYKCQLISRPNEFYALKIIKNLPQYYEAGISEISIHEILKKSKPHPGKKYISKLLSTFEVGGHICMISPLYNRSLFEGLWQNDIIEILEGIRNIMQQLLLALDFMHTNGIIHCDIKPDNILFTDDFTTDIVVVDFGSATTDPSGVGQYLQSRFYRSPEVILGLPYNQLIDIWSAGCIAAELYLDFVLFACENEGDCLYSMIGLLGPIPDSVIQLSRNWWKYYNMTPHMFQLKGDPCYYLLHKHYYHEVFEQNGITSLTEMIEHHHRIESDETLKKVECFADFVRRLLDYDPRSRVTAEQALQHPFIKGEVNFEKWMPPIAKRPGFCVARRMLFPNCFRKIHSDGEILSRNNFLTLI